MNMPRASNRRAGVRNSLALMAGLMMFQPGSAFAGTESFLPVEARQVEPARPVAVLVPQRRIASSIELGRIAFPGGGGGGVLGVLLVAGMNDIPQRLASSAAARSEALIAPLAATLTDFDATVLALDASNAALNSALWLGAGPPQVLSRAPDPSEASGTSAPVNVTTTYGVGMFGPAPNITAGAESWEADAADLQRRFAAANPDAAERTQIMWRYQMSPDFVQVRVIADVAITRRGEDEPYYNQQVISIARLARPSFVEEENVARWSANNGAVARSALTSAFSRIGEVLPHVIALDQAGFSAMINRQRENVTVAGFHGPVLLRDAVGPVFWAQDNDQGLAAFVTVQTASD